MLIKALLMRKGWPSFWSSCFPNFTHSWYVLSTRAGLPKLHCFRQAGGNACACACVLPRLRDGACSARALLPSLPERKRCFLNVWQRCRAPFRLPRLLPSPFHGSAGTGLVGAPVSSGAVEKGGQLTVCCRSVCLDSSGRAASGRDSYFSWLFVIILLGFCKVVRESQQPKYQWGCQPPLCVTHHHHYGL